MIQQYYDNIRKQVCDMIEKKKSQNMKMLSDNSNSQMGMMKHARIKGDYYNLDDKLFQLSLKIYNGQNILQLVSSQQSLQMEKAYQFMSVFNSKIDQLFSHFNFKFRIKPPEINKVSNISKPINRGVMKEENYVEEAPGRLSAKFKTKNNT